MGWILKYFTHVSDVYFIFCSKDLLENADNTFSDNKLLSSTILTLLRAYHDPIHEMVDPCNSTSTLSQLLTSHPLHRWYPTSMYTLHRISNLYSLEFYRFSPSLASFIFVINIFKENYLFFWWLVVVLKITQKHFMVFRDIKHFQPWRVFNLVIRNLS